jgi:hypothetical protein
MEQLLFSRSGDMLTVTPTPMGPAMMGTVSGASFTVRAVLGRPGIDCVETYQLMGTFLDANRFTGTFSINFTDPILIPCSIAGCASQSYVIQGNAVM